MPSVIEKQRMLRILKRRLLKKDKSAVIREESLYHKVRNTAKEFATVTTLHGCSYIANDGHSAASRMFWVFVVGCGITFGSHQVISLYKQWETNPVIRALELISLPLEDVDYPGITVCPQGYVKDIMENVLFQQFQNYVLNKTAHENDRSKRALSEEEIRNSQKTNKVTWNLTSTEMDAYLRQFLEDTYPGALDKPTEMIPMMVAQNPKTILQSESILHPIKEKQCNQDQQMKRLDDINRRLNGEKECPIGYKKVEKRCAKTSEQPMTYEEGKLYCGKNKDAEILHVDTYKEIEDLVLQKIAGMNILSHRHIYT